MGSFAPDPGANWSKSAGQVASMARAAYRALNGALTLASVSTTVHPLNETDGSLNLANLAFTASVKRALANDVTVCGENEPVAYVTEYFLGDGVTTQFDLAEDPFFPPASKSTIVNELFNEPQINQTVWNAAGGGYITLGPDGLTMNGGNGIDGETTLAWLDPIEMGGTLLLEAGGSDAFSGQLRNSGRILHGYQTASGCTAGFQATAQQGTGAVTLQPIVQGTPAGTTFAAESRQQYTLRMRIHCPESYRAGAMYYSFGDSGPIAAGGGWLIAPGNIQMEMQEFVNGVGATPVTLYDGAVTYLPAPCNLVPASSINLIGTMRAINLTNLGSGWVVSTPPGGGPYTRRIGTTAEAAECHVERTGKLAFYTGYTPVAGEQIAVSYRTIGRAVGRAVNTASQQALAAAGSPSVAAWIGSVTAPPARTSADCRNAAQVMEQAAASVSALWSGTYKGNRSSFSSDVWPGDALLLNAPSTNLNAEVVVRTVKVTYSAELSRPSGVRDCIRQRLGRRPGHQDQRHGAGECMASGAGESHGAGQSDPSHSDGAERQHGDGQYGRDSACRRRIRDSPARLCVHARAGSDAGAAGLAAESDVLAGFGQRPVLHPDVRRLHAAQLLGVLNGVVHQFAAEFVT